eukprot:1151611-Pelagomonas_calceolata.AAC.1
MERNACGLPKSDCCGNWALHQFRSAMKNEWQSKKFKLNSFICSDASCNQEHMQHAVILLSHACSSSLSACPWHGCNQSACEAACSVSALHVAWEGRRNFLLAFSTHALWHVYLITHAEAACQVSAHHTTRSWDPHERWLLPRSPQRTPFGRFAGTKIVSTSVRFLWRGVHSHRPWRGTAAGALQFRLQLHSRACYSGLIIECRRRTVILMAKGIEVSYEISYAG